MKILELLGNTAFGGATLIVADIAQALRSDGHEVHVMANDDQTQKYFQALGFECHSIEHMGRSIHPLKDARSVSALRRFVRSHGFDAVHSHTTKGGIYARVLKLFQDSPIVIHTVHGYYLKHDGSLSDLLAMAVERFFYPLADHTTFVNRRDFDLARGWSKKTKAHLIHNGVDTARFSETARKDLLEKVEASSPEMVVGISARIVHEKGYREFMQLMDHFSDRDGVRFEILGTGPDEDEYRRQAEALLKGFPDSAVPKLVFYGHVEDVRPIIARWDINVLPSYREGLSISLLEAMAMGIPSVATRIRGNVEIIEDGANGLLFEPMDAEGLIHAVGRLIDDRELRNRFSINAAETVRRDFGKEKMLKAYLNIFTNI